MTTIDEYIAEQAEGVRPILSEIRATIGKNAPGARETIKYRMPTFVLNKNLVHFAAFGRHIGFYPTPSGIKEFKDELSLYHNAKGSVQFSLDKPIPFGLVRKIVKFRVKETRDKLAAKSRRTMVGRGKPK